MDTRGLKVGIDFNPTVNRMQATIDVHGLKRAGIDFFCCKVSEGIGWSKPAADSMRCVSRAWQVDLPAMAYHFGWGNDPEKQVATFLRAIGGVANARRMGLCLDVETYNGHTKMRRGHVLGFYRELARKVSKDCYFWAYSGDWFWRAHIDTGKERPVLEVLRDEGINVKVWSSPDTGYADSQGESILATARRVPESEFVRGFSGQGAKIVQVDDACRVGGLGLYPIDGNVSRSSMEEIRKWFNWRPQTERVVGTVRVEG